MKTVHAVYEHGVFRPLEAVDLAERTEVEFDPKVISQIEPKPGSMEAVYAILSERYESGKHDTAECHNEHQP